MQKHLPADPRIQTKKAFGMQVGWGRSTRGPGGAQSAAQTEHNPVSVEVVANGVVQLLL